LETDQSRQGSASKAFRGGAIGVECVMGSSHYDIFTTKPPSGSRYAFHVTAVEILEAEPSLPPWFDPVEVGEETPEREKAWFRRHNSTLSLFADMRSGLVLKKMQALGLSAKRLKEPREPSVQCVFENLILLQRLAHREFFSRTPKTEPLNARRRRIGYEVISAAQLACGTDVSDTKLAEYLNAWLRNNDRGITRHHVRRALKKDQERCLRGLCRHGDEWLQITLQQVFQRYQALEIVLREAITRTEFRDLRGAELALRIHEKYDLSERVWRAYDAMDRRQRVA
jgi:hypothetical protein